VVPAAGRELLFLLTGKAEYAAEFGRGGAMRPRSYICYVNNGYNNDDKDDKDDNGGNDFKGDNYMYSKTTCLCVVYYFKKIKIKINIKNNLVVDSAMTKNQKCENKK
jgi:hypothetical protein